MQQITNMCQLETAVDQYGEIVISKNNKNTVVLMTMEEYKNKILKEKIEKHLQKSEEDIENGRTRKAVDVLKELEEKYGF